MDGEDDDPVVSEVDVFLSQSLADTLYLVQYPLRPGHMTYKLDEVLSARVRPTQQRIELDVGVRSRGVNYSTSRGENFARLVELGSQSPSGHGQVYRSGLWDKYTLTSDSTPLSSPRYVAGVFKDNELHLTPLHAIVQMRSSLSHLDKADTGAKKAATATVSGSDGGDTTESEGEEAKPVVVKFARRESKVKSQQKNVGRRQNFQEVMENRRSSENWVPVEYNDVDSEEAGEERKLLFADRDDQTKVFSQSMDGYIDVVCPKTVTQETTPPVAMPTGVLSLADLKSLPLAQQVVKLLHNAHMIQFNRLCSMLGAMGGGVMGVCEAVRGCAVLVQGSWVVSSQHLLPGEENASKRNSRDYILWCFNQHRFVPRKDLVGVVKLSPEALREMLQQLATPRVAQQQGWEFKLPTDIDFVNRFPSIAQHQEDKWKQRYRELVMELGIRSPGGGAAAKHTDPSPSGPSPSLKIVSGEQLVKNAQKKVRSLTGGELAAMNVKMTPSRDSQLSPHSIAMDTASAAMETVEPTPRNTTVKTEQLVKQEFPASEQLDAVVQFCSESLGRGVLSMLDLRNRLLLKQTTLSGEPNEHVLSQQGVSDRLLEEGLMRCGALEVGQPCNKRLFGLAHGDPCREAILTLFQTHKSLKKKQLVDELSGRGLTSDIKIVSALLKELCYSKGAQWRLQGT